MSEQFKPPSGNGKKKKFDPNEYPFWSSEKGQGMSIEGSENIMKVLGDLIKRFGKDAKLGDVLRKLFGEGKDREN